MFRLSRHRSFLQACAFALLLLGVVCKPVLAFVGELHAVEHAALAGHADDHDSGHGDDHGNDGEDPGHALGGHGLLHQCSGGTGSIPSLHPLLILTVVPATVLPPVDASPPARPTLTLPFRPPIA